MRRSVSFLSAALVLALAFALCGCDDLIRPETGGASGGRLYRVSGGVSHEGAYPSALANATFQSTARTALPTLGAVEYKIEAKKDGEVTKIIPITTDASEYGQITTDASNGTSFTLNLPKGKWTLTVTGTTQDGAEVLTGKAEVTLSEDNPVAAGVSIKARPTQKQNGTGKISLSVGTSSSDIKGVRWTLAGTDYSNTGIAEVSGNGTNTNTTAKIDVDTITSGVYTLVLEFYSGYDSDGTYDEVDGELLYTAYEAVNVFDNLTTDTWSGGSPYLKTGNEGSDGETVSFVVDDKCVNSFAQRTFFVDGENDADQNDDGSEWRGTYVSPLATVQAAVNRAVAMNAVVESTEDEPYRIYLLGDVTNEAILTDDTHNALVDITPDDTLYLEIASYGSDGPYTIDANRSAGNPGRVMYVDDNANVTLRNVTLTGGYMGDSDSGGGGICLENGNLVLESGAVVSGNTSGLGGGGIYISGGKLSMEGGEVSSNNATKDGGGIYISTGTAEISGGTISGNKAENGGGVYNAGTLTMSGGTISDNKAMSDGSGLYVSGFSTIKVSGNIYITSDNDVYFNSSAQPIIVAGELKPPVEANGIVATITLTTYSGNPKVIDLSSVASESTEALDIATKFNINSGDEDKIRLEIKKTYDNSVYCVQRRFFVKQDSNGTGLYASPLENIQNAVDFISTDFVSAADDQYEIVLLSDYSNTTELNNTTKQALVNINPSDELHLLITSYGENKYTLNAGQSTYAEDASSSRGFSITQTNGRYGRVFYIGNSGTSTITNVTLKNVVLSGSYLQAGVADQQGGGIYMSNSNVTLDNSSIMYCNANSGGGVYLATGSCFTMQTGSTISKCLGHNGCAGVMLGSVSGESPSVFNFEDGTIEYCFDDHGGAIFVSSNNTVNMSGGKIVNCCYRSTNTAVYVKGEFNMSGDACINDYVFLFTNKTITVTGNLSKDTVCNKK